MRNTCPFYLGFGFAAFLCASAASAQGAAPEPAPPLFPGGGLISYNSAFTTRSATGTAGIVPATARPTFSHEGTSRAVREVGFERGETRRASFVLLCDFLSDSPR